MQPHHSGGLFVVSFSFVVKPAMQTTRPASFGMLTQFHLILTLFRRKPHIYRMNDSAHPQRYDERINRLSAGEIDPLAVPYRADVRWVNATRAFVQKAWLYGGLWRSWILGADCWRHDRNFPIHLTERFSLFHRLLERKARIGIKCAIKGKINHSKSQGVLFLTVPLRNGGRKFGRIFINRTQRNLLTF